MAAIEKEANGVRFIDVNKLEEYPANPKGSIKRVCFHSDHNTFSPAVVEVGHVGNPHKHPHEQLLVCLDGELKVICGGKTYLMQPGQVLIIPSFVEHSAYNETDKPIHIYEVFYPVRMAYDASRPLE